MTCEWEKKKICVISMVTKLKTLERRNKWELPKISV